MIREASIILHVKELRFNNQYPGHKRDWRYKDLLCFIYPSFNCTNDRAVKHMFKGWIMYRYGEIDVEDICVSPFS